MSLDDPDEKDKQAKEPEGENKLLEVISYIREQQNHVIISAGFGEPQITQFSRTDSCANVYSRGQPHFKLKGKVGDHTDVIAIELKIPDGTKALSDKQNKYLKKL